MPLFSIQSFFSSALWLEREAWDLFGLKFLLHFDLRRILTDYGFRGHPMLKHFPLLGYIEIRYDDRNQAVI
jgi:NADH-quinone oxidoreductase subunit C